MTTYWSDDTGESHDNVATVLRAAAIDDDGVSSRIVTATYFVGETGFENNTVISIVADPEDLFGDNGIYVTGDEFDEDGRYYVRSVYFDDYDDTAYHENEMGVDPRRKYRIRLYNGDAEHLTLERKAKYREKIYKESVPTRPIMSDGQHILEVKYDALIPDFVYNTISGEKLRRTTYSKYYLCRKIGEGR